MRRILAIAAYLVSIVAANWLTAHYGLVPIGFGLMATAGTYAAGCAFVARDAVQDTAGRLAAVAALAVGAVLSWFLSTPALAVASAAAFGLSELVCRRTVTCTGCAWLRRAGCWPPPTCVCWTLRSRSATGTVWARSAPGSGRMRAIRRRSTGSTSNVLNPLRHNASDTATCAVRTRIDGTMGTARSCGPGLQLLLKLPGGEGAVSRHDDGT